MGRALDADERRLFFGAQVEAPWPVQFPKGRMIPEETRHITVAFLGQQPFSKLEPLLGSIPKPSFHIGPVGSTEKIHFLPPEKSRVAALSAHWLDKDKKFDAYHKVFADWLKKNGFPIDERPFFPHITLARAPFEKEAWEKACTPLPFFVKALHLYESMENLHYRSLWSLPFIPPFEEFEHTADIAFTIRGKIPQDLHLHAQIALAFHFPPLLAFFSPVLHDSLDEMIIALNEMVGKADAEFGCPFKAVSFHGKIFEGGDYLLHWEMIVDV